MKISDLFRIAAKNLKGRWMALIVLGFAISTICLCFYGAVLTAVDQEKSLPYELNVSSGSTSLSDNAIAEISEIPDVTSATPVLQVPASIKAGEYSAQLTLEGIYAGYLSGEFAQGGIFPDSSVMPYIVLNEAACKQLSDEENGKAYVTGTETSKIDWLKASVSVQANEGVRPAVSKISGILATEEEGGEPAAYIGISSAKSLLQRSGQNTDYTGAFVRITNIGCAKSVSGAIAALGLSVAGSVDELQAKWDAEMKEAVYLVVIGVFCLLCSAVLTAAWRRISLLEHDDVYRTLQWIGMKDKDMGKLFAMQSLMISIIGAAVGIIVCVSLPSFLLQEQTSIFTLPIPLWIAALSAVLCIIAGTVPLLSIKRDKHLSMNNTVSSL